MTADNLTRCSCPKPTRSTLKWVTQIHPSGNTHLPGRERLAKVCSACGRVVEFSHSEHCNLILDFYKPLQKGPSR